MKNEHPVTAAYPTVTQSIAQEASANGSDSHFDLTGPR